HAGLGQVAGVEVADEVRREQVEHEHSQCRERPHRDPEPTPHTRFTGARPKRPVGRTSSTPRITASATGSRSSVPTQSTYVPIRLISTPSSSEPTTAPSGLSSP